MVNEKKEMLIKLNFFITYNQKVIIKKIQNISKNDTSKENKYYFCGLIFKQYNYGRN